MRIVRYEDNVVCIGCKGTFSSAAELEHEDHRILCDGWAEPFPDGPIPDPYDYISVG